MNKIFDSLCNRNLKIISKSDIRKITFSFVLDLKGTFLSSAEKGKLEDVESILSKADQLGLISDLIDVQEEGIIFSREKYTALIHASRNGHEHIVRLLIERNANVKLKGSYRGMQAIHKAAEEGHLQVMKLLVNKCPELLFEKDMHGCGTLWWARYHKHDHVIKWLKEEMGVKE